MDIKENETEFENAVKFVRSNTGMFDSSDLLYLYGRYKQVTEGKCNTPKPGWFDFQGKAKWEAWKGLADKTKEDCKREYVEKIEEKCPEWQEKAGSGESASGQKSQGMGVAVSTMADTDDVIADTEKSIFDWLKEDNQSEVMKRLGQYDVNENDEDGLTLLHWACDRGLEKMALRLLEQGANVNAQDTEKQTPLHYAVSCEHPGVIRLLLQKGADSSLCDSDGLRPQQLTTSQDILKLFDS